MRNLLFLLLSACGASTFESNALPVEVLPTCGECFRVVDDVCVEDGTCAPGACAARPDLPSMTWTNDPGLNWHVDFGCER